MKREKKSAQITYRVTDSTLAELETLCRGIKLPTAFVARLALEQFLDRVRREGFKLEYLADSEQNGGKSRK